MRPSGSPKVLEQRRRRAVRLLQRGRHVSSVARAVNASVSSVLRWKEAWELGGIQGLSPRKTPGRPRRLSAYQRQELLDVLSQGARANGFSNELWTLRRIATLIRRQFDVSYHPSHVWKILRGCGWSCQVPERRAFQRDEQAIDRWKREQWPAIKKSPKTWGPSGVPR